MEKKTIEKFDLEKQESVDTKRIREGQMKDKIGNRLISIMAVVCVLALIAVGIMGTKLFQARKAPKVTTSVVTEQLKKMSDLTTSQLQYRGLIRYEEGNIMFINKKSYTMLYDANVKAGIDLSKSQIEVFGKTIKVSLPAAAVQEIMINPDTLEFYDEKNSLFNWENKQDTVKALQLAKEDADTRIDESELLKQAEQQAKVLIQNLLLPLTKDGDYTTEITFD